MIVKIDVNKKKIKILEEKGWIKIRDDRIILRLKMILLIEDLLSKKNDSKIETLSDRTLQEGVTKLRLKWKGLKPGSMGSEKSLKQKLKRWMEENPKFKIEDILKAADIYLESLNNDFRYLQQVDYFVFKKIGTEEQSRLSAFVEEINDFPNKSWTSEII